MRCGSVRLGSLRRRRLGEWSPNGLPRAEIEQRLRNCSPSVTHSAEINARRRWPAALFFHGRGRWEDREDKRRRRRTWRRRRRRGGGRGVEVTAVTVMTRTVEVAVTYRW